MSNHLELDSYYRDRQAFTNPCDYTITAEQVDTWIVNSREVRAVPQSIVDRPLDFVSSMDMINATLPYPRIELFASRTIIVDSITGTDTFTTLTPHGLNINDIVMTSSPGFFTRVGISRNTEYHVVNVPTPTTFKLSLTAGGAPSTFGNGTGLNLELAVITPADYADVIGLNNDAANLAQYPRVYVDVHSDLYKDIRRVNSISGILSDAKFVLTLDKIQYDVNLTPVWIHYKSHGEQVMRFKRNNPLHIRFFGRDGKTTIPFFNEPDLPVPSNPYKQTILTMTEKPYSRDALYTHHDVNPISNT